MVQMFARDDRLRGRRFGENFSDRQSSSDRERNCLIPDVCSRTSVLSPNQPPCRCRQQTASLLYLGSSRCARPLPHGCAGHVAHPSRSIPMSASSASAFSTFYFLISTFSVPFASTETLP